MKSEMKMPRDREVKFQNNSREFTRIETLAGHCFLVKMFFGVGIGVFSCEWYIQRFFLVFCWHKFCTNQPALREFVTTFPFKPKVPDAENFR